MNQTTTTLLVTPWHEPSESLLGYALRVSEKNGYDTPWHILSLAGLPQGKMDSAGFPFDQFAEIVNRNPEDLKPLAYHGTDEDGKRRFQILGHPLGGTLHSNPLRLSKPQLCPHCIQEHGYIDAFFDLSLAVACPEHGRTLVGVCPGCGKRISWFRPGLLTCKCGADLAAANTVAVSAELRELMAIISAKVHGKSLNTIDNACNFPIKELESVSLRDLLEKTTDLGRCNLSSLGRTECDSMNILQAASEILQDWPNAFHAFLRRQKTPNAPTYSLSKHYEELFASLLERHKRLPGADFLCRELISFAKEAWDGGVISWQLVKDEPNDRRFVSNSELASRIGMDRRTLKKRAEQNIVSMKSMKVGKQNRYIIDIRATEILTKADGKSLGEREAAAYIGLPVSVLQSLRRSGHFKGRFLPTLKAFHELDLNAFIEQMLALGEKLEHAPGNTKSLEEVMRLKFRNSEGKADFVRAILSKTIVTAGCTGEKLQSLLFPADQVETFLRDHRAEADGNSWSIAEAAKFLHCDPNAIPSLIEEGQLDAIDVPAGKRVTEESIKEFDALYVSVAKLAKKMGTSSRKLQREMSKRNIPLTRYERGYGKAAQAFVSVEHEARFPEIFERINATPQRPIRPCAVTAVKEYLSRLKETGASLPRRDGKPNKAAIAKACGFDRSALYSNARAMALLSTFEMEEREHNRAHIKGGVAELRRYLNELGKSNLPLPKRAGKPNKSFIASICGFDRALFYSNPEAMMLLCAFDAN